MDMKIPVLLVFFIFFITAEEDTLPSEFVDFIDNVNSICANETGVSNSSLAKIEEGVFPDDRNFKCYLNCILTRSGLVNSEGNLDVEDVPNLPEVRRAAIRQIVNECSHLFVGGDDPCERAFTYSQCHMSRVSNMSYYALENGNTR